MSAAAGESGDGACTGHLIVGMRAENEDASDAVDHAARDAAASTRRPVLILPVPSIDGRIAPVVVALSLAR